MKKRFDLVDLDCANCARKMEDAIRKLEGVNDVTVSFIAQRMTIDAEDGRFDDVMKQVVKTIRRVEPDCQVVL